jgi:hypothetical protein
MTILPSLVLAAGRGVVIRQLGSQPRKCLTETFLTKPCTGDLSAGNVGANLSDSLAASGRMPGSVLG